MESYKDVIVSQPPAMYAQSGYTTNFAVENYKGILLCERPSNMGSINGGGDYSDNRLLIPSVPFVPSNPTGNVVGYGPSKESRHMRAEQEAQRAANLRQRQAKSVQALSRHRKWLRSFAKQMKMMKESDRQLEVAAAQRAAKLRNAEKRRLLEQQQELSVSTAAITGAAASENAQAYNMKKAIGAHVEATLRTPTVASPATRKPKWALTEEEAMDAELDVDRDLLRFAENLDYEKFISDFEVAEALGIMRDRVEQIAKANNWSVEDIRRITTTGGEGGKGEDDDDDLNSVVTPSEARLLMRNKLQQGSGAAAARPALSGAQATHEQEWDSSSCTCRCRLLKKAISRDALALAERLFAASPSLQKIHTRHSLARVLQRCALEGNVDVTEAMLLKQYGTATKGAAAASPPPPATTFLPPAIPEPLVVRISADAVTVPGSPVGLGVATSAPSAPPTRILRELQQSTERTQGLPYLYRCPAI